MNTNQYLKSEQTKFLLQVFSVFLNLQHSHMFQSNSKTSTN